jgi:PadR family transcriptional regulator, regulatory protein PadR
VPPRSDPPHPRALTVSPKELLILELLAQAGESYGLQLVAASNGQLKRGTVYVTLGRMADKGYITATPEDAPPAVGGLPRPVYRLTTLGRRMLRTWRTEAARVMPVFAR